MLAASDSLGNIRPLKVWGTDPIHPPSTEILNNPAMFCVLFYIFVGKSFMKYRLEGSADINLKFFFLIFIWTSIIRCRCGFILLFKFVFYTFNESRLRLWDFTDFVLHLEYDFERLSV